MIDKEKALEILEKALSHATGDMAEAVLEGQRLTLTRFAESRISDNIDNEETTLYVRSVKGQKIGVTATGDISDEGIKRAVNDCEAMLKYMLPDDKFVSFPKPDDRPLKENSIIEGTADFGPERRAKAVGLIGGMARKGGGTASGAFRIEEDHLAVANSLGVRRYYAGNRAELSMRALRAVKRTRAGRWSTTLTRLKSTWLLWP